MGGHHLLHDIARGHGDHFINNIGKSEQKSRLMNLFLIGIADQLAKSQDQCHLAALDHTDTRDTDHDDHGGNQNKEIPRDRLQYVSEEGIFLLFHSEAPPVFPVCAIKA